MRHFSHYIEKAFLKHHQSQKMHRAYLSKGGKKEKLVFIKGEVRFITNISIMYLFTK